jgi:molybdate transport system substrate-binding protein
LDPSLLAAEPLIVAAASDLAPLEGDLSALYQKTYGKPLRFVVGSSGLLASQIRHGAPYDVYLSANVDFTAELERSGSLVPGSVRHYATGRLAVFSTNPAWRSLEALARPELKHIAIANPTHAPYGVAAKEILLHHGLWDRLKSRLVYGENIRQTLQLAESGNADAALVSWSLVREKGGVLLPASGHAPIRQTGGIVSGSGRKEDARRLLELLTGAAGRELLLKHGFSPGT